MDNSYRQCIKGHYFRGEICPYCGMRNKNDIPAGWKYNDDVDIECAEMFPSFCTSGGANHDVSIVAISKRLHMLRERALEVQNIESTEWYGLMHLYIDEYTMRIIERKQCYKYGLPELDKEVNVTSVLHRFWALKKVVIKQDYGLDWYTPDEVFKGIRKEYLMRT